MAVTEVKQHSAGASGSATGGKDAGEVNVSYTTQYHVTCDSQEDTAKTVLLHFRGNSDLPWIGRPFKFGNDFDVEAICKSVNPTHVDKSAGKFVVQCAFESQSGGENQDGQTATGKPTQDPIKWHDEISIGYTQISVPVEKAIFRQFNPQGPTHQVLKHGFEGPVTNSALTVLNPPLERELDIKVLRISRYIPAWNDAIADRYQGAVNQYTVVIDKPAYKFKMFVGPWRMRVKLTGDFGFVNNVACYKNTIEALIHPDFYGWRSQVPDQGIYAKVSPGDPDGHGGTYSAGDAIFTATGVPPVRQLTDEEGFPLTHPVNFDGQGQPLKDGKPPQYLVWSKYKEIDFSDIPW